MIGFLKNRIQGFKHAFNGLFAARKETHIRIHLFAAVVTICIGVYQEITALEWVIIIGCIGFVLVTELINTALEKTVDYISLEQHPNAKTIKDISAGAVLVSAITAAIIGIWILFF